VSTQFEPRPATAEDDLAAERASETRSEYFAGQILAMTGASRADNVIAGNSHGLVWTQLRGRPCEAYIGDMRVKVNTSGGYTYPDVVVVCGEPRFEDEHVDTLLNPTLIVEVLSPSTERYDRGRKLEHYRRIPSLAEYVLVAQDARRIEWYTRQ
jgi:Uma2 family endonuclease